VSAVATPRTPREAAELIAGSASVRPRGGGTKLGWGIPAPAPELELRTSGLARILAHESGDFTAVLEAGVPLAEAQAAFARAGQMLALDPPDLGGATIGGVLATADAGPLAHRFGTPRELVLGITVALADGAIAKSGGTVIKNVAGYDLGKLFTGAFGTLGTILAVCVRLHPRPQHTATARGRTEDPDALASAARTLAAAPLEPLALDVAWRAGGGELLARFVPGAAAGRAVALLREHGLQAEAVEDDDALWERQRAGQRAVWARPGTEQTARPDAQAAAIVRVAAPASRLADVIRAACTHGGSLTGRAGMGISYVALAPAAVPALRTQLGAHACVVLDAPEELRASLDPWGMEEGPALELMRRVKARFDPAGACSPGRFVGAI
jgi:glycolate oxidase FAD binding subunit